MKTQYSIVITPAEEGGFIADIPALPGCMSQGATEEEASSNILEALEGYLACLSDLNQKIPTENLHPQIRKVNLNLQNNLPKVSFA